MFREPRERGEGRGGIGTGDLIISDTVIAGDADLVEFGALNLQNNRLGMSILQGFTCTAVSLLILITP